MRESFHFHYRLGTRPLYQFRFLRNGSFGCVDIAPGIFDWNLELENKQIARGASHWNSHGSSISKVCRHIWTLLELLHAIFYFRCSFSFPLTVTQLAHDSSKLNFWEVYISIDFTTLIKRTIKIPEDTRAIRKKFHFSYGHDGSLFLVNQCATVWHVSSLDVFSTSKIRFNFDEFSDFGDFAESRWNRFMARREWNVWVVYYFLQKWTSGGRSEWGLEGLLDDLCFLRRIIAIFCLAVL